MVTITKIIERKATKETRLILHRLALPQFYMAVKFGPRELKIPAKSRKQMLLCCEMRRRAFWWTFTDVSEQPAKPTAL